MRVLRPCVLLLLVAPSLGSADLPPTTRIDQLVVDKSARTMDAHSDGRLIKTYRIAVGRGGLGPKRYEGDARTPEGRYRIDRRHRSQRFHRFLHVSYPNRVDYRRYRQARRVNQIPRVGIGGAIGIHGGNHGVRRTIDWTAGCIAVRDAEAEELYRTVAPNAVVIIRQ